MQIEIQQTQITIPVDPNAGDRPGYRQRHVQIRLSDKQAETLFRLRRGVALAGKTLESGREVSSPPSALVWLLEQIAERV